MGGLRIFLTQLCSISGRGISIDALIFHFHSSPIIEYKSPNSVVGIKSCDYLWISISDEVFIHPIYLNIFYNR